MFNADVVGKQLKTMVSDLHYRHSIQNPGIDTAELLSQSLPQLQIDYV